jgi:hypothetical protein
MPTDVCIGVALVLIGETLLVLHIEGGAADADGGRFTDHTLVFGIEPLQQQSERIGGNDVLVGWCLLRGKRSGCDQQSGSQRQDVAGLRLHSIPPFEVRI